MSGIEGPKKPSLQGSLVREGLTRDSNEGTKLRGSLAPKAEAARESIDTGKTVPKEALPNVEALTKLEGREVFWRDGNEKFRVASVSPSASGNIGIALESVGPMTKRIRIEGKIFLNAITTEGGNWRLIGKEL